MVELGVPQESQQEIVVFKEAKARSVNVPTMVVNADSAFQY